MAFGRVLIGPLGGLCAAAGTALLLVDNVALMRLGVVCALWAAALATIVVAWVRRDLRDSEHRLRVVSAQLEAARNEADEAPVSAITA